MFYQFNHQNNTHSLHLTYMGDSSFYPIIPIRYVGSHV